MSHPEHHRLSLAVALFLLTAQVLLLLHTSVKRRCGLTTIRAAGAKLQEVCCRFFSASASQAAGPPSEIEEAVRQKVLAIQLAGFHKACQALTVASVFNQALIVTNTLRSSERIFTLWQDVVGFATFGILFLRQCWPGLLNSSRMNLWYGVLMGLGTLMVAPGLSKPDSFTLVEKAILPWISVISMGRLNVRWVTLWQGVFSLTLLLSYILSDLDPLTKAYSAYAVLGHYGIIVLCTGWLAKSLEFVVRNEMEAGALVGKMSAGNALLKIFYDVVMELDTGLVITNSGGLGGFLRCGRERSFQGTRLQDFLPSEEDKERFTEHMCSAQNAGEGLAAVMHLLMGHEDGQSLKVELFSFQFQGPTGRSRHLIGLREFSDDSVAMEASVMGKTASSSMPTLEGEVPSRGPLWLEVDIMPSALPVTACSPALQRLLGLRKINMSISALLDSAADLVKWIERIVNQHMEGVTEGMEEFANSIPATLRPRKRRTACIQATCQVELSSIQPFTEDDDGKMGMPVVLTFQVEREDRVEEGSASGCSLSSDSRRRGTPRHADDQHVGKLPSQALSGRVQCL